MNCQRHQESFAEAHDGLLSAEADAALRAHLASCPACRRDWDLFRRTLDTLDDLPAAEPSPRLRAAFEASLAAEIAAAAAAAEGATPAPATAPVDAGNPVADRRRPAATRPVPGWRAAWQSFNQALGHLLPSQPALQAACAALLLCGGLLAGRHLAPTPAAGTPAAADEATRRELASLREQVSSMGQLVAYSLAQQQQQPVGTRLQNVSLTRQNAARSAAPVSPATLSVLVNSLAFDASTNVRLSALEALYEHADQPLARQAVLAALPRERSPIVQLAMIDFIASLGEPEALPVLGALARDPATHPDVAKAASRLLLTGAAQTSRPQDAAPRPANGAATPLKTAL